MLLAMLFAALLCILIGSYPQVLYKLLPFPVLYHPYDFTHVISQLQLLLSAALAFAWPNIRGLYPPELPAINLVLTGPSGTCCHV
jgi:multicomponent Na+:H+ antiporter subunit D